MFKDQGEQVKTSKRFKDHGKQVKQVKGLGFYLFTLIFEPFTCFYLFTMFFGLCSKFNNFGYWNSDGIDEQLIKICQVSTLITLLDQNVCIGLDI